MAISFSCLRCGASSASLDDFREGYCGSCHAWTGGLPPGVVLLTPASLLWDPRWRYEHTAADGQSATFSWTPQPGSDVMEWRPAVQLGSFTATWVRTEAAGRCILTVPTEPLCREILERTGLSARAWSWDELRRLAGVINQAVEDTGSAQIPAEQVASGSLTWDRPDADPLGDLQQARGLMEQYAEAHPDPDLTVADVLGALHGAGLSASAELTPEQYEAAQEAMEHWHRARERAAARQRTRLEHHGNLRRVNSARTRQVLDDAEALIARLDGEGYKVADKARRIEAAEGTAPPELLDRNHAMSWRRGDPAL